MNAVRNLTFNCALVVLATSNILLGADLAVRVEALLDAAAKNTPPAVKIVDEHAETLKRRNPDDPRIDYVYGLVLAKQHRYADALAPLGRYLQARPSDLRAWRAKLWVAMQARRYDDAWQSIAKLAEPFDGQCAAAQPAELTEAAKFLGTVFGYLELVQTAASADKRIAERKNGLLGKLSDAQLAAFDEGREIIASELEEFQTDRDARAKRAEEAVNNRKHQAEDALRADRDKIADQREIAQAGTQQLSDAGRDLSVIQHQINTLAEDRTRLSAQIVVVQTQITTIMPIEDIMAPVYWLERHPLSRDDMARVSAYSISLGRLNKQAFDMDRQILGLKIRAAKLMGDGTKAAELLEESATLSAKAEKRAAALERQLNRIKTPAAARSSTPRSAAPTGRMAQFSTYVPFPYEQERERVLSWFAK